MPRLYDPFAGLRGPRDPYRLYNPLPDEEPLPPDDGFIEPDLPESGYFPYDGDMVDYGDYPTGDADMGIGLDPVPEPAPVDWQALYDQGMQAFDIAGNEARRAQAELLSRPNDGDEVPPTPLRDPAPRSMFDPTETSRQRQQRAGEVLSAPVRGLAEMNPEFTRSTLLPGLSSAMQGAQGLADANEAFVNQPFREAAGLGTLGIKAVQDPWRIVTAMQDAGVTDEDDPVQAVRKVARHYYENEELPVVTGLLEFLPQIASVTGTFKGLASLAPKATVDVAKGASGATGLFGANVRGGATGIENVLGSATQAPGVSRAVSSALVNNAIPVAEQTQQTARMAAIIAQGTARMLGEANDALPDMLKLTGGSRASQRGQVPVNALSEMGQGAGDAGKVPVEAIRTNPAHQPRAGLDEANVQRLVDQFDPKQFAPVEVRPLEDGGYELIHGHHRFAAAQRLGLKDIPARVLNVSPGEAVRLAEAGNLSNKPLTTMETARVIARRLSEGDDGAKIVADLPIIGVKAHQVKDYGRLVNLPTSVQQALDDPVLSKTFTREHGVRLARAAEKHGMPPDEVQAFYADVLVRQEMTPPQMERLLDAFAPTIRGEIGKQGDMFGGGDFGVNYTGIMQTLREAAKDLRELESMRGQLRRITGFIGKGGENVPESLAKSQPDLEKRIAILERRIEATKKRLAGQVPDALEQVAPVTVTRGPNVGPKPIPMTDPPFPGNPPSPQPPRYAVEYDDAGTRIIKQVDPPLTEAEIRRAQDARLPLPDDAEPPDLWRARLTEAEDGAFPETAFTRKIAEGETPATPEAQAALARDRERYEVITNERSWKEADDLINANPEAARSAVMDMSRDLSAVDSMAALNLMKRAQDAGNIVEYQTIARAVAQRAREAGQGIQALANVDKLSPERIGVTAELILQGEIAKKGGPKVAQRLKQLAREQEIANIKASSAKLLADAEAELAAAKVKAGELRAQAAQLDKTIKGGYKGKPVTIRNLVKEITDIWGGEMGQVRIKGYEMPPDMADAFRARAQVIRDMPEGAERAAAKAALLEEINRPAAEFAAAQRATRNEQVTQARFLRQQAKDLEYFTAETARLTKAKALTESRTAIKSAKLKLRAGGVEMPEELAQAFLDGAHKLNAMPVGTDLEKLAQHRAGQVLMQDILKIAPPSKWMHVLEALSLPRSLAASLDLSWMFRQGMMSWGHPGEYKTAAWDMLKAFKSEGAANAVEAQALFGQFAKARKQAGLQFVDRFGPTSKLEEGFLARGVGKVPGLGAAYRGSERAFTTAGNKFRMDAWDSTVRGWLPEAMKNAQFESLDDLVRATGRKPQDFTELARAFNAMTGRSSNRFLDATSPVLTPVFWAPRYAFSRVEAPSMMLLTSSNTVRKMMIKDMAAFAAAIATPLAVIKLAGGEVELDPRSQDFAKGKIAGQKFDFTAGVGLNIRVLAQALTGQQKMANGRIAEKDRMEAFGDYFRGKLSPAAAVGVDVMSGSDAIGRPVQTPLEIARAVGEKFLPMSATDVVEAYQEVGWEGAIAAGMASASGVGVTSYSGTLDAKKKAAQRLGKNYDDMNPSERNALVEEPEVKAKVAEMEGRVGSPMEVQLRESYSKYRTEVERSEGELEKIITQGVKGEALRKAVQEHNDSRFKVGRALFTPELTEYSKRGVEQPYKDVLRDRYWGADAPMVAGEPDFKQQEATRAAVLREADASGVSAAYIKDRAYRPKTAVVRETLEAYYAAQDTLRPYWELKDKVYEQMPAAKAAFDKIEAAKQSGKSGIAVDVLRDVYEPVTSLYNATLKRQQQVMRAKDRGNNPVEKALQEWYPQTPIMDIILK